MLALPAELSGVVHVGSCFDISFLGVVDGGGSGVCSSKDEDISIKSHSRGIFVIWTMAE